jgi:DNA (cytosine-5)-methyltransferase 1
VTGPRLLDLFCGAGGAAMGYYRAGFDVVGVDIIDQPNYPFRFIRADAMDVNWRNFEAVHASPPCQAFTAARSMKGRDHPDLLTPTRPRLQACGRPYVIENVPGAPMRADLILTGCQFGLQTEDGQLCRPRLFELGGWTAFDLMPPCAHTKRRIPVFGHNPNDAYHKRYGQGSPIAERREVMGIDWTNREELAQAIPPAFTEWIGLRLLEVLADAA